MRNPFHTSFAAVFTNEVLLSTKRVAPYAMSLLFCANAVLWWGWGPAVERGWATNSDFYIQRNLGGFSFVLGLPIFTAVIMGDPVIRDLRLGVHPLIFAKPIGRGSYLLGKFLGNFFVLVCCQSVFTITTFALQWVPFSGMVTLPVRVLPYVEHFIMLVVISHLILAAFYFAAGTLTRNAKIVYGLAVCFYPVFFAHALLVKDLPVTVRILTSPVGFIFHIKKFDPWTSSADVINQYVAGYDLLAYSNRAVMIAISALLLLIVYLRFRITEGSKNADNMTVLKLSSATERIPYSLEDSGRYELPDSAGEKTLAGHRVIFPKVSLERGPATTVSKIAAAIGVEFQLMRTERSLVIIAPLTIFISILEIAFYRVVPELSYSVTYATNTAGTMLLFIVGMIIFYTGEAMHRDREVKIEPVMWSMPIPNSVLLLSTWLATVVLMLGIVGLVGVTAIVVQLVRGHTPVDFSAYLIVYGVVLVPVIIFVSAAVVALNVLLRNKHLAYVVAIGTCAGLYYLYSLGYHHWLYNPLLYRLWTFPDLTSSTLLEQRVYHIALALACLALAHLLFHHRRGGPPWPP